MRQLQPIHCLRAPWCIGKESIPLLLLLRKDASSLVPTGGGAPLFPEEVIWRQWHYRCLAKNMFRSPVFFNLKTQNENIAPSSRFPFREDVDLFRIMKQPTETWDICWSKVVCKHGSYRKAYFSSLLSEQTGNRYLITSAFIVQVEMLQIVIPAFL